MAKKRTFLVLGATQYQMLETPNKSFEIANWFHNYYSHTLNNKKQKENVLKKARRTGYYEEKDRIYVIS